MPDTSSSVRAPWKRSACDRCRAQKLRCLRDETQSRDTCLRCLKSGSSCVTSMSRPTGRPPSHMRASHSRDHNNSTASAAAAAAASAAAASAAAALRTGNSSPDSGCREDDIHTTADLDDSNMSLDNFLDNMDTWNSEFNLDDDAMTNTGFPPQAAASVSPTIVALPSHLDAMSSQADSLDFHKPYTATGCIGIGLSMQPDNHELLLSSLYSELAAQFCTVSSSSWDVKGTLQLSFSYRGSAGGDLPSREALHPLAQVSRLSAEFEKVLSGLQSRSTASFAYHLQAAAPRLRTTQLLVVLSCYLQIISIYDVIFSKVLEYLLHSNETSNAASCQAGAPIMYLGGLPVAPNHPLSSSLLVHLTEHQLHKLEQLIGLPEFYRVSSRPIEAKRDDDMGLFGCQRSKSLFHAVIQLGEDRHDNYDDTRCVRSLKRTMRQIKDF